MICMELQLWYTCCTDHNQKEGGRLFVLKDGGSEDFIEMCLGMSWLFVCIIVQVHLLAIFSFMSPLSLSSSFFFHNIGFFFKFFFLYHVSVAFNVL